MGPILRDRKERGGKRQQKEWGQFYATGRKGAEKGNRRNGARLKKLANNKKEWGELFATGRNGARKGNRATHLLFKKTCKQQEEMGRILHDRKEGGEKKATEGMGRFLHDRKEGDKRQSNVPLWFRISFFWFPFTLFLWRERNGRRRQRSAKSASLPPNQFPSLDGDAAR